MRQPTLAEIAQMERRKQKEYVEKGYHIWAPEQLVDIKNRIESESIESIARQYHCSVADVQRGLKEAE